MCNPFNYPTEPHIRRHGPRGYTNYPSFKPWLRDEFTFRCVYCLVRERWYPNGQDAFSADHVIPQSLAPERVCDYENLVYACLRCNSCKQARPLPDPCTTAYAQFLRVHDDGTVQAMTPEGGRMIDILILNDPEIVDFRRRLMAAWLGFPLELPNLARLRPRDGNTRTGGLSQSWFAQRQHNQLPAIY